MSNYRELVPISNLDIKLVELAYSINGFDVRYKHKALSLLCVLQYVRTCEPDLIICMAMEAK